MENNVPKALSGFSAEEILDRSIQDRRASSQSEIERLIAATFRVIERSGQLEPKVSEILSEAGLSNQAFYRHFRGKRELLVAVLDDGIRELADYLTGRMRLIEPEALPARSDDAEADSSAGTDALQAVTEWIRGMAAQTQDPESARASRPFAMARGRLAESFPSAVAASEKRVTAPLRDALERAKQVGAMPEVAPEEEAEALYHLMMGWVEARLVEGRAPAASEVERLEAFILAGLTRGRDVSE